MDANENKVKINNGETAAFTDGTRVHRTRPDAETASRFGYSSVLQVMAFCKAFAPGRSEAEVKEASKPDSPVGSDGVATGSTLPSSEKVGVTPKRHGF
jgi:hypothetical protein